MSLRSIPDWGCGRNDWTCQSSLSVTIGKIGVLAGHTPRVLKHCRSVINDKFLNVKTAPFSCNLRVHSFVISLVWSRRLIPHVGQGRSGIASLELSRHILPSSLWSDFITSSFTRWIYSTGTWPAYWLFRKCGNQRQLFERPCGFTEDRPSSRFPVLGGQPMTGWENSTYCWVVICKNTKVHRHTNLMFGHRIPLAETDPFEAMPVSGPFYVRCDDCGQEHSYEPEEVMRVEMEIPTSLTTHPRFS